MGKSLPTDPFVTNDQRPTVVRYGVLGLLAFAAGSAYLTRHCIAVANTTIQKDLGFDNSQMSDVFASFFYGYLIFQVPGGWLGNRFGTRKALASLSVLWSVFTLWTAAVTSLVPLMVSRFAFGLAQAGLAPVSAKIVKDWFPVKRRGIVSAVLGVSMSVGGAVTMESTAVLMEEYDWREVFRLYSMVGIAWAIVFFAWFRTRPEDHRGVNEAERRLILGGATSLSTESERHNETDRIRLRGLMRNVTFRAILVQSFCRAAGYNLFVTFFPAFLEFAYGLDRKDAGSLTKWPLIGVITGGLAAGFLIDLILRRTDNKWYSRSCVAAGALGLTTLLTVASTWTTTPGQFVAVISIGAMFSGMANPSAWAATIDVGGRHTAVIVGLMNMAGCLSGVIVTPLLGRLIDEIKETDGNWNLIIFLHAGFYLTAAVAWVLVKPDRSVVSADE